MDREFKVVLFLYVLLLAVGGFLLEALAGIHPFTPEFLKGFLPFALLLAPYLLFSSGTCLARARAWLGGSTAKKISAPLFFAAVYVLSSAGHGRFDGALFVKLCAWLASLAALASLPLPPDRLHLRDFAVALLIWLPIEFGQLPGFDIIFKEGIQVPALAFVAPAFGLYLFAVLRGLDGIGYDFRWRPADLGRAGVSLLVLAALLIPLGTASGFIRFSNFDSSAAQIVQLLFGIYFLVALPEELLFRGIFQNLLARTFPGARSAPWLALASASLLFGFSHYNNFNPPDWRYVWLASLAGLLYGWTYMRTGRTTVSALVHCGVNVFWALFFKDTAG